MRVFSAAAAADIDLISQEVEARMYTANNCDQQVGVAVLLNNVSRIICVRCNFPFISIHESTL